MLISPPFLSSRPAEISDAAFIERVMLPAATNCPGTGVPEGSFPLSMKLGWHGGTHLHAPASNRTTLPVRSIADGYIVYARRPTAYSSDANHQQNYNPYGSSPSWTDNGMVIIKHITDIGTGINAKGITYYSLITHLSELRGNFFKVANGTAQGEERQVCRKDIIGVSGKIYGVADHIHMEIICDDANMKLLIGRTTGDLNLSSSGRDDAVYGEVYFYLPIGTNFYHERPTDITEVPTGPINHTTAEKIIVGIRYCNGDGDHPGDGYVTSYSINGMTIGNGALREPDAEYDLLLRASAIAKAYEDFHCPIVPTISALYELLRFGRVIGPDKLNPSTTPHWRHVSHPTGSGWVNLNALGVSKFSDADFPGWRGWLLVDDDTDRDSRCNSSIVMRLIDSSNTTNGEPSRTERERCLALPATQLSLSHSIAKFPSEWNRDTIDERWGWLQMDPECRLEPADWNLFREHLTALTVPAHELPEALRKPHWHFHPCRFISHVRNVSWLSETEMIKTLPKYLFYSQNGNPRTAVTSMNQTLSRSEANSRLTKHYVSLNQCIRKYLGSNRQRAAIFLAQVILETAQWRNSGPNCRLMHEWYFGQYSAANPATQYYGPFYGRGIMQLTWAGNYRSYGQYRALPSHTGAYSEHLSPASPRITTQSRHYDANPADGGTMIAWSPRFDPDIIAEDPYAACDSGGFYWVSKHFSGHTNINRACDSDSSPIGIGSVNRLVNGGGNGYYERQAYAAYLLRLLTEDISTELVHQVSLPPTRSSIAVNFSRT